MQPPPHIHTHIHTLTHTHTHSQAHTHSHTLTHRHSHTSQWRNRATSVHAGSQETLGAVASNLVLVSPILVPKSLSLALTPEKHTIYSERAASGSPLPSLLGLGALPDCGKLLRVQGVACEGEAPRCWRGEQLLTYYPDTLNPWPHTLQRKQLNQVAPGM